MTLFLGISSTSPPHLVRLLHTEIEFLTTKDDSQHLICFLYCYLVVVFHCNYLLVLLAANGVSSPPVTSLNFLGILESQCFFVLSHISNSIFLGLVSSIGGYFRLKKSLQSNLSCSSNRSRLEYQMILCPSVTIR